VIEVDLEPSEHADESRSEGFITFIGSSNLVESKGGIVVTNESEGIKDRIKARLLEATSDDDLKRIRQELRDEGEKPGSIDACVSELRKQGHLKFSASSGRDGTLAVRKAGESVLPEWLQTDVAEIFDGQVRDQRIFLAGMSVPMMGLRLFAEGVKPIIDLMATWQRGQAEAARAAQGSVVEAAQVAGEAAAGGVAKFFMETKPWLATAPNPMQAMMVDAMRPIFNQLLGQVIGGVMRPTPQGQPGAQPGQQGQPAPGQGAGFQPITDQEREEVFGGEE